MATSNPVAKLSRGDWKKAKELDEARKAGTAPAEVDEEGKDINPHIPQYIREAPWYVNSGRPSLKHQRPQEKEQSLAKIGEWFYRGQKAGPAATKFRKGACENCGAMTHKKKDCMERPRKLGARFTGKDIMEDEILQPDIELSFDGKRDRWNGYDPQEHQKITEEYVKMEEAKKHIKVKKLNAEFSDSKNVDTTDDVTKDGDGEESDSGSDEDEDKYVNEVDMPGTKFDTKQRMTVRNLRIREDTAKYLYNLAPNAPHYDPKTRSMRENPFEGRVPDPNQLKYAGDNFVRHTGDTVKMAQAQVFAWEATDKGSNVHLQAEPTKLQLLHQSYADKKDDFKKDLQESILAKYGGEEHLDVPPKELLLAQSENYVEYSQLGDVIRGQEKAVTKTKYDEDVYINNHTEIWGSYFDLNELKWGFACCHSFVKNSYCVGKDGTTSIPVADLLVNPFHPDEEQDKTQSSLLEQHQAKKKKKEKKKDKATEDEKKKKDNKLKKALEAEEKRIRGVSEMMTIDERKRPYNQLETASKEMTEEEMEAYYIKRHRAEDPMAKFIGGN